MMRHFLPPMSYRPAAAALPVVMASRSVSTAKPAARTPLVPVKFDDSTSYRGRSTWYLIKALCVLKICSISYFSTNSVKLMKLCESILGSKLTYDILVRRTVYDYFCAGANDDEVKKTIGKLNAYGIGAVLDYAAEADTEESFAPGPGSSEAMDVSMSSLVTRSNVKYPMDEAVFEENMKLYMMCMMYASLHTPRGGTGVAAVKVTGMCDPQLLARMSAIIMSIHQSWCKNFTEGKAPKLEECNVVMGIKPQHQLHASIEQIRAGFQSLDGRSLKEDEIEEVIKVLDPNNKGRVNYFRFKEVMTDAMTALDPSHTQKILVDKLPAFTNEEKQLWKNVCNRLYNIGNTASTMNVRMLVDAEQTFYQLAIDAIVSRLQRKYNKTVPVVFNTYQCYLTYAEDRVANDIARAKLGDFQWGGKMVRGAYIEQERQTAEKYGYASPIWPTYEATSKCYNDVADRVLRELESAPEAKYEAFFGTHNRNSLEHITNEVLKHPQLQERVSFGQLYGMRDNLTIPLSKAGFGVYKYLPYGPVRETVHYLGRRAVENRTVLTSKDNDEPRMMKQELLRRFKLSK